MPIPDPSNPLVPTFNILINGTQIAHEAESHITFISIEDDIELPSMFSFELVSSQPYRDQPQWIDEQQSRFKVGTTIDIRLGYGDVMHTVIIGEITGLEPEFNFSRMPSLTVRGYDRRHRLQRGQKTRSFVQVTDSDIASQIARDAGFAAIVEDSKVMHSYIVQANKSDLSFLQERARSINYNIAINDRTLIFMPIGNEDDPALTMSPLDDLMEFYPRLSLLNQSSEVRVCSSDARKAGEKLEWRSERDSAVSVMGGDKKAAAIAEGAFGGSVETINNCPVMSLVEAEELANARYKQNGLSLITGEGVCRGRADVCSGKVVQINGVGHQFSGNYYVTATTHHYRTSGDYTTHFYFQRNAA